MKKLFILVEYNVLYVLYSIIFNNFGFYFSVLKYVLSGKVTFPFVLIRLIINVVID